MPASNIKYKRIFNTGTVGGMTPSEEARLTTLENNEIKVAYFAPINTDTGTITIPTGATILLDQFPGGVDAFVSTLSSGQPTGNNPITAGSVVVDVSSFDALGNYTLTGTPNSFPVALIYVLKIDFKDWSNLVTTNILEWEQYVYTGTTPISINANTKVVSLDDDGVTNAKLANMSTQTIKGRTTAGTGDPEDLTKAQTQGILGLSTTSTDNAITRFDGALGNTQNSTILLNDEGSIVLPAIAGPSYSAGKLAYDSTNEALTFFNNEADIALQIGQETYIRVFNNSGSTISNGAAVYISGQSSGLPTIALARSDSATTTRCIGLATHSIENNTIGYVTNVGLVRNFDTSAFSAGTVVFLSSTVAGGLTSTEPTGTTNYSFRIGFVITSNATTGTVQVIPSTAMKANNLPGYQGYTIQMPFATANTNPGDATTYYFGNGTNAALVATATATRRVYIPKEGTIKAVYGFYTQTAGASNENSTLSLRLNNTTDTTITTTIDNSAPNAFSNTALSIAVVTGDYIEGKWVTPTWATNPTGLGMGMIIYIE